MTTPAGWYSDPSGAGGQRYFDGTQWADHQPQAPVRKRRKWPWIVAGSLVLVLALCATAFVVGSREGTRSDLTEHGPTARDGEFEFVLTHFTEAELQNDPQATREYFIATVAVTNTGGGPQSFAVQNQKLIDEAGREYPAIGMVSEAAPKNETTILNVDPGATLKVHMRFEGPRQTRLTAIELHDSASSAGARVSL